MVARLKTAPWGFLQTAAPSVARSVLNALFAVRADFPGCDTDCASAPAQLSRPKGSKSPPF